MRVRKVTFANGGTETLARFIDAPTEIRAPGPRRFRHEDESVGEQYRRKAVARARRELRWALRSIEADHLLTCTFRENVQDRGAANRVWSYFIKLVRARYPHWHFVAVMELQDRGAIHFHAGVKGYQDVRYLRTCWLRAAGDYGGNIDVRAEYRRFGGGGGPTWSPRRLIQYLGKYLGKAMEWLPKGSHRYHASYGRPRPSVQCWWIEYSTGDDEVIRSVYRATCGERALDVTQWLSRDGGAYMVSCMGPPRYAEVPF